MDASDDAALKIVSRRPDISACAGAGPSDFEIMTFIWRGGDSRWGMLERDALYKRGHGRTAVV
jgi:hypothetical protein